MAFGIFGKRRRDGQPATAEEPPSTPITAAVEGDSPIPSPDGEIDIEAAEAMLPRWRRPSLLQARRADTFRDDSPPPRMTFDPGAIGQLEGQERRVIRYRLVRMLDTPDELRGTETGYLDRGDEVQMLEKYGAYWLVVCPDGRQGWVHNMTLGEVVGGQLPIGRPVAPVQVAVEAWTADDIDDNNDVLEAYLESRRRGA